MISFVHLIPRVDFHEGVKDIYGTRSDRMFQSVRSHRPSLVVRMENASFENQYISAEINVSLFFFYLSLSLSLSLSVRVAVPIRPTTFRNSNGSKLELGIRKL